MIRFILNDTLVETTRPPGSTLLDFIRYERTLVGTKIGCREGDCGACTVILGEWIEGQVVYKTLTSCITPLGNANGRHVVTIEGLNMHKLTPYQQAMVDHSGSQCGFCTVGFILSFAGACITNDDTSSDAIISAVDGNICRCTGYKSIERAAAQISQGLEDRDPGNRLSWLVDHGYIPPYFMDIPSQLEGLSMTEIDRGAQRIGGGTDLLVQRPDAILEAALDLMSEASDLKDIEIRDRRCWIGAATSTTDLMESEVLQSFFPNWRPHLKLVSSTVIRNIATIAGNFVNASPIGDLTAIFIALNSQIEIGRYSGTTRYILLKDLFTGYKQLAMADDEYIRHVVFDLPSESTRFHFEKVSKRTYLDIASVNSAISVDVVDATIRDVHISAGGVAPIPSYLTQTCAFLRGQMIREDVLLEGAKIMQTEIAPISDARGSQRYKRRLLHQLYLAHFLSLFPEQLDFERLVRA